MRPSRCRLSRNPAAAKAAAAVGGRQRPAPRGEGADRG